MAWYVVSCSTHEVAWNFDVDVVFVIILVVRKAHEEATMAYLCNSAKVTNLLRSPWFAVVVAVQAHGAYDIANANIAWLPQCPLAYQWRGDREDPVLEYATLNIIIVEQNAVAVCTMLPLA